MSATGQGGVSIITGANHAQLSPVALASGDVLTFTHNLGRRAYSVICSDGESGRVFRDTELEVEQPTANEVTVSNVTVGPLAGYIAVRWENLTTEADIVSLTDPRVDIGG